MSRFHVGSVAFAIRFQQLEQYGSFRFIGRSASCFAEGHRDSFAIGFRRPAENSLCENAGALDERLSASGEFEARQVEYLTLTSILIHLDHYLSYGVTELLHKPLTNDVIEKILEFLKR